MEFIVIYLCIHGKWLPWVCVTKLRDNCIFKALVQIKRSSPSILIEQNTYQSFNVTYRLNLFGKFRLSKFYKPTGKLFYFCSHPEVVTASEFSSNTLIRKRIQTGEETNTTEIQ